MKILFLVLVLTSMSFSAENIYFCNTGSYSNDINRITSEYNKAKDTLISEATKIGCYPKTTGSCDHDKLQVIAYNFQKELDRLGLEYQETNLNNGECYPEMVGSDSPFEVIPRLGNSSQQKGTNSGIEAAPAVSSGSSGFTGTTTTKWEYVEKHGGCQNVYYLVRKCHDEGLALKSCRMIECRNPNGGNTCTEYTCEGPSRISSSCAGYFTGSLSPGPSTCNIDEGSAWDHAKACYPADIVARRQRCPRGCVKKGNSYPPNAAYPWSIHLWDWSDKEWDDYSGCVTSSTAMPVKLYRDKNGGRSPDVNQEGGNPIRLSVRTTYSLTDKKDGIKKGAVGGDLDGIKIELMSVRGHKASYCIEGPGHSCQWQDFDSIRKSGHIAHPDGYVSTKSGFSSGTYTIKVKNDSSGHITSKSLNVISRTDFGEIPCWEGRWSNVTMLGAMARDPNGSKPTSAYEGQTCPCTGKTEKDSSGQVWKCFGDQSKESPEEAKHCLYYHDPKGDKNLREEKYLAYTEVEYRTIQTSKRKEETCTKTDGGTGKIIYAHWLNQKVRCNGNGSLSSLPCNSSMYCSPRSGYILLENECTGETEVAAASSSGGSSSGGSSSGGSSSGGSSSGGSSSAEIPSEAAPATSSNSCVYYHWPKGEGPYVVKNMNKGSTATRDLAGKKESTKCQFSDGEIITMKYTEQTIGCNGDSSKDGDGLFEKSSVERSKILESNCAAASNTKEAETSRSETSKPSGGGKTKGGRKINIK